MPPRPQQNRLRNIALWEAVYSDSRFTYLGWVTKLSFAQIEF
jgi:hypothetical protein